MTNVGVTPHAAIVNNQQRHTEYPPYSPVSFIGSGDFHALGGTTTNVQVGGGGSNGILFPVGINTHFVLRRILLRMLAPAAVDLAFMVGLYRFSPQSRYFVKDARLPNGKMGVNTANNPASAIEELDLGFDLPLEPTASCVYFLYLQPNTNFIGVRNRTTATAGGILTGCFGVDRSAAQLFHMPTRIYQPSLTPFNFIPIVMMLSPEGVRTWAEGGN